MTVLARVLHGRIHVPRRHHPALTPADEIIPIRPAAPAVPTVWQPTPLAQAITLPLPAVPLRPPPRPVAPHRSFDQIDDINERLIARLDVVAQLHECVAGKPGAPWRLASALGHAMAVHALPYLVCSRLLALGA